MDTLLDEAQNIHESNLLQFQSLIDSKMEEVQRVSSRVSVDDNFTALLSYNLPLSPQESYKIREVQETLARFEYTNEFVSNIFVYYPQLDFFLSSSSIYRSVQFDSFTNDNFAMDFKAYAAFLEQISYFRSYIISDADGEHGSSLAFIQAVSANMSKTNKAYILSVLNIDLLSSMMQNTLLSPDNTLFIQDENNHFIAVGDIGSKSLWDEYKNRLPGPTFPTIDFYENRTLIGNSSPLNGWEYVSIVPTDSYLQNVNRAKNMIVLYFAVCTLLGIPGAYLLTKKYYNPLKGLTKIVRPEYDTQSKARVNEYGCLENAFNEMVRERATVQYQHQQQARVLRNQFLGRLLKGRNFNMELTDETLTQYEIHFPDDHFFVILFLLDDFQASDCTAVSRDDTIDWLLYAMDQSVGALYREHYPGYMCELDGMLVFIASCTPADGKSHDTAVVNELSTRAQALISHQLGVESSVFISPIQPTIKSVSQSYLQVVEAADYCTLIGKAHAVVFYDSLPLEADNSSEVLTSFHRIRHLSDYIANGDFEAAKHLLHDILSTEIISGKYTLQTLKTYTFGIAYSMILAFGTANKHVEMSYMNKLDPIKRIINTRSVAELNEQFEFIINSIITYSSTNRVSDRVEEIAEYIKQHFFDPDLSVTSICDDFQITPSYFSRIFKKHTGMYFPDFIHQIRVEQATLLLVDTNLSISAIAKQTGFSSSRSMSRVFRACLGSTPSEFRANKTKNRLD